jgi:type III pantothenate kinase
VFPKEYIGRNTKECLEIGVMKAVTHEIDGFVHQYNKEFTDLTVVLTGGNTHLLAGQLKNSIFANSNFQLAGLYNILIYNLNALKK